MLPINLPDSTNTYSLILLLHIPDTTTKYSWCYQYLSLQSLVSKPDAWLKTCTDFCRLEKKYQTSQLIPVNIENAGPDL